MNFCQLNAEIAQKTSNGQLLFLAALLLRVTCELPSMQSYQPRVVHVSHRPARASIFEVTFVQLLVCLCVVYVYTPDAINSYSREMKPE